MNATAGRASVDYILVCPAARGDEVMGTIAPEVRGAVSADFRGLVSGAVIVIAVLFMPKGILPWRMARVAR